MAKPPSADSIIRNIKKKQRSFEPKTPIADDMFLPNPSGAPDYLAKRGMAAKKIINVLDPTANQDVATKKYVDDNIVTDHGALTGLTDDDHTQYQKETDFTAGSVLFRGSSVISEDNTKLFWDDTNNRLSIGEISSLLSGIDFYWKLDESSGTNANDESSNNRDGTLVNMADSDWVSAKLNNGVIFDAAAAAEHITIPTWDIALNNFTIAMWIFPTTQSALKGLFFTQTSATFDGIGLWIQADDSLTGRFGKGSSPFQQATTGTTDITFNAWNFIVFRLDNANARLKIFINNVEKATFTTSSTVVNPGKTVRVASHDTGVWWFDGTLDEISFWNRALTDAELTTLYNSGTGESHPFTDFTPAPVCEVDINGGFAANLVSKTANYTATSSDHNIICGAGNETFTITLPASSGITDLILHIKNIGTGTITVDGNASETIDGSTTAVISTQFASITIQCDGSNWHII